MRFNFAALFALTATTQLAIAAPLVAEVVEPATAIAVREPQWNGKNAEAGYKVGAVVCGSGAYLCNKLGHTVGQDVLTTAAFCCSGAAAIVTASQATGWVAAWDAAAAALGKAATVGANGVATAGGFVAKCTVNVCQMIASAVAGGTPSTRSIDPPALANLVARSLELEGRSVGIEEIEEIGARQSSSVARDLTLLDSTALADGGVLESWGSSDFEEVESRDLSARAKCTAGATVTPVCDDSNGAQNALCASLLGQLLQSPKQTPSSGASQICYTGVGGSCCTGWSTAIKGLQYSDLYANANTMSNQCLQKGGISGKMNGVTVYGVCVNQCLNDGHSCGN
ncbi:hypothetical protein LSUE1_G008905 [Lachnellula suecica]|uniref:WD-like domain-containing protein n=1 Tax=Lachnellula suecica TaxID=602035 RepID=A0A8T9C3K4_9HELO|nr:hypothetical protein LSUE1_G008905 [Lachnellula suecica]